MSRNINYKNNADQFLLLAEGTFEICNTILVQYSGSSILHKDNSTGATSFPREIKRFKSLIYSAQTEEETVERGRRNLLFRSRF